MPMGVFREQQVGEKGDVKDLSEQPTINRKVLVHLVGMWRNLQVLEIYTYR